MVLYESSKVIHGRPTKNRNYIHVGFFLHYKPISGWEPVLRKVDQINEKIIWKHYRSTETEEPIKPEFSKEKYGEKSNFPVY